MNVWFVTHPMRKTIGTASVVVAETEEKAREKLTAVLERLHVYFDSRDVHFAKVPIDQEAYFISVNVDSPHCLRNYADLGEEARRNE